MRLPWAALFMTVLCAGSALAQIPAERVADAQKALVDLKKRAADSHVTGRVPRLREPEVDALFKRLFDTSSTGSAPLPISEIKKLGDWVGTGAQAAHIYFLAGTGTNDLAAVTRDPAMAARLEHNTVEFAPELSHYYDFTTRIAGVYADMLVPFVAAMSKEQREQRQAAIAQVSKDITGMLSGTINHVSTDKLTDQYRRDRLRELNAAAPKVARFLTPEHLKSLRDEATEAATSLTDPGVQSDLKQLASALSAH